MPPTTREQDAHGLAQRPVPPPAALDLDPGAVEPAPSRSGETPGAPRPSRPARTSRGAQAGATQARGQPGPTGPPRVAAVPAPSRELGRQQAAGGLVVPVQLRGFRWVLHACVAAVTVAPGRAAVIGAHRGADASAPGRAGQVGFGAVTEARFRAAESLGVPARGVVPQVVVDVSCVAPIAPVGRRATVPSRARVAIPNVKVISFAAHASSLVARRSPLAGMRPLPEGRARRTREPAGHKRYLLETMFTGWSVLPLGYRPGLLAGILARVTGWGYLPAGSGFTG